MLFSSITFLFYFLPAVMLLYFLLPRPGGSFVLRNLLLLVASLIFYAWGEPVYVLIMLAVSLSAWAFGLLIDYLIKHDRKKQARWALAISVILSLSALLFFKYSDFLLGNINSVLRALLPMQGEQPFTGIQLLGLALPLGISFYTFQIISYSVDLYRGMVKVQKNPLTLATYVTLFPQLIAGPIVRYKTVEEQMKSRQLSLTQAALGCRRFCIGLGKKVILANTLGQLVSIAESAIFDGAEQSTLFAVLYLVAFSLQIYFDFSGYSDMAIGIGLVLGFTFPENFNYPYTAKSVTDFWRRWHMSLSSWFRDYVYIPLGGNRVSSLRHILNIVIVWMATGFWHGAGWNFIFWGLYFAILLIVEKFVLLKAFAKLPGFLQHLYLLVIIALSWILFQSPDLSSAWLLTLTLFGQGQDGLVGAMSLYYLGSYLVIILVAAIGCTELPKFALAKLCNLNSYIAAAFRYLEPVYILAILIVVTSFLADGSFNPFIYFRF